VNHDPLFDFGRNDLERLKLAADVILAAAEEFGEVIPSPLESELVIFKERVEKALLLPKDADWRTTERCSTRSPATSPPWKTG
jgi:hypothetical protein